LDVAPRRWFHRVRRKALGKKGVIFRRSVRD
jgi:hypothetical protein